MLDSSRLVKLFLPLLLGHMSTGRSEVNKHIKQLCTYKNVITQHVLEIRIRNRPAIFIMELSCRLFIALPLEMSSKLG